MSISRRQFLGWVGAAGLSTALGSSATAATTKHFEGHPDSFGVLFDSVLCIGCRSCEEGCNRVNELPPPDKPFKDLSALNEKRRTSTKAFTVVNRYNGPKGPLYNKDQCNHCLEPACASACFVRALQKTKEGPVIYDASVCVGCRYCMVACPFEIPTYEYYKVLDPKIMKCTMCYPRIIKGLLPGCVEICPTEALSFGKRDLLIQMARERIRRHPDRYVSHIFGEREMGGTNWLYLSGVSFSKIGMREDLGVTPAPELTSAALASVPMIVGLWPVVLTGIYAMTKRSDKIARLEKEQSIDKAVKSALGEAADPKTEEDS